MMNSQNITPEEILDTALKLHREHYRLIQICATRLSDRIAVDYSFGRGYEILNYKTEISIDGELPSISPIFYPAFLYENEMHDLYGITIRHLEIDYHGKLYRTAVKNPFNPLKTQEQ